MVHSASLSNFSSHDYILVIYSMTNFSFTLLPFTGYLLLDYSPCKEPSECSFETKGCFEGSALLRFLKKIHMCGSYYVPTIHSSESYVLYIIKSRWNSLCLMGSHLLSIYQSTTSLYSGRAGRSANHHSGEGANPQCLCHLILTSTGL